MSRTNRKRVRHVLKVVHKTTGDVPYLLYGDLWDDGEPTPSFKAANHSLEEARRVLGNEYELRVEKA